MKQAQCSYQYVCLGAASESNSSPARGSGEIGIRTGRALSTTSA